MYLAAILDSSRIGGNFKFYFWIIRVVNSQIIPLLQSSVRCNGNLTHTLLMSVVKNCNLTITNFNSECSRIAGFTYAKIVVKADLVVRTPSNFSWSDQANSCEFKSRWCTQISYQIYPLVLTSSGQEWQFHIASDIKWSRIAISHCYWCLVVKNGNFSLLLTSSGQEWQFHIATWHLVVKNGNFTLLLMIQWSRMAISHCYWHLVVKNCNFTLLLMSSSQELQFHIASDI